MNERSAVLSERPIVSLSGITIEFPGVKALDRAELQLFRGEIHALLGEGEEGSPITIGGRRFRLRAIQRTVQRIAPHIHDAAFIRFTSGTTGTSKGVVLSHRTVVDRVEAANKGLGLTEQDAVVWVMPIAYHFVVSIMLYLYFGVAVILCDDFTARATFAKSFFETGGIEAVDTEGFTDPAALGAAFKASGAALACLCSSDKVYAGQAADAAGALQAAGARHIYLAGRPGEQEAALRAAGVNEFVFAGGDALTVLQEAYRLTEHA